MKKKSLLWISALLLMLAGCSSDDVDENDVSSQECRYSYQSILPSDEDKVVTTQDSWTITTYANMITRAEFNSNSPSSAELFFKNNMPLSTDNVLKFSHSLKNSSTNYKHFDQLIKAYCF